MSEYLKRVSELPSTTLTKGDLLYISKCDDDGNYASRNTSTNHIFDFIGDGTEINNQKYTNYVLNDADNFQHKIPLSNLFLQLNLTLFLDSSKDYGFYFPKPFQNILVCETVAEVDTCKTSSPSKDTPIADLINDKMWEYNASTRQWEEITEIPLIYLDNKKPYYNKFTQKCWMKDIDDKYSDIYLIYGLREMVPLNYHMNIPMVITYCSDGSIQPYTQSTYKGEETQLTENRFVREGYIFTGWQDKDKKPYVDKAIVTFYRNTDLYAQWEELNVLIDHDNNYICDEKGNYIEYDDKT